MQYLFAIPVAAAMIACALLIDLSPQPGRDELLMLVLASAACIAALLFVPARPAASKAPAFAMLIDCALVTLLFVVAVFALPHITIQWLALLRLTISLYLMIVAALSVVLLFPGPAERARQLVIIGLAALFALPVWLGPIAEVTGNPLLLTNLIVAASPLSAFAVALDLDVMRTSWFYQYSVLGSLRYGYLAWFGCVLVLGILTAGLFVASGRRSLTKDLNTT